MKRLRLYIRAFFGFSRMETNGFLILMPLMLVILCSERVYRAFVKTEPLAGLNRTDSLVAWIAAQENIARAKSVDPIKFHFFDPNKISRDELIDLGLNEQTANRIERYRNKGGRFRQKEELAKIYGMDSLWLARAATWMVFPNKELKSTSLAARQKIQTKEDINTADTLALQDVYGIGPALARRIITFRDRLGGFISMDQLREVYGLDSVVVGRVKRQFDVRSGFEPRRIYLREASWEELNGHPYISHQQARAIITYRSQHSLDSLGQLRSLPMLDEKWFNRMQPYLRIAPLPP